MNTKRITLYIQHLIGVIGAIAIIVFVCWNVLLVRSFDLHPMNLYQIIAVSWVIFFLCRIPPIVAVVKIGDED